KKRPEDCPYLHTINRQVLNFNFKKKCSVSNQVYNVYACLVCGKYYQGRSRQSPAYAHSLKEDHHIYINLETERVYCLPDGDEIIDPSLDDIRHNCKSHLVNQFGELVRKIWAPNFKGQIYPHEFLQAVMGASNKRFGMDKQSNPVEFMSWLLNALHADLASFNGENRSIIQDCFRGELEIVKEKKDGSGDSNNLVMEETYRAPFVMLGLDLPPPPVFRDAEEKITTPQVPLYKIMKKFDGESVTEVVRPCKASMRYHIAILPQYLILHMRRFTKNNYFVEKNPTLVKFPVKNLELKDYNPLPPPNENEELRSKYDLIANTVHDGEPDTGSYRVFVQQKSEELWYEIQDLRVAESHPDVVALSEAYIQIYEQQHWGSNLVEKI
ncbi:hypothetical protein AQUCO_00700611v1, partial [Aquilegia coerulea]